MEMNNVCRLCLQYDANMTAVFDGKKSLSQLQLQIQDHCSIQILPDDGLPKNICNICKQKLYTTQEFRQLCKRSDYILREQFKVEAQQYEFAPLPKVFQDIGIQVGHDMEDDLSLAERLFLTEERNLAWTDSTDLSTQKIAKYEQNELKSSAKSAISSIDTCDKLTAEDKTCSTTKYYTSVERQKSKETKAKKFVCHMCQKVYVSKRALQKHTEAHMKQEILMCTVCNKSFNSREKLSEHMKKHSDDVDLKCDVCDMPFKERVKLNFHLRIHGKGPRMNTDKQYLCDMCSRTFASKSGLRFHLKSHNGSKPYPCKFCNKSFPIPSYRIRHERTHSGEKHLVCHICSAAFASSNGLKYHLRSHTGEANYHCETCGKSFRRLKYLKEHNFTHTGERPFICKICGTAYGNSGSLFVHEKKCKAQYTLNIIEDQKIDANNKVSIT